MYCEAARREKETQDDDQGKGRQVQFNEQENKNEDDQKSTTQYVKMIAMIYENCDGTNQGAEIKMEYLRQLIFYQNVYQPNILVK